MGLNMTINGLQSYSSYTVSVLQRSGYDQGTEAKTTFVTLESGIEL